METALQVTVEQMALVTGSLPVPHRSFLPTSQPYSDQVAEVFGECLEKRCVTVYPTYSHYVDSTSFVSIEYEINYDFPKRFRFTLYVLSKQSLVLIFQSK